MTQRNEEDAEGGARTHRDSGEYHVARITVTQVTTTMTFEMEQRRRGPGVRKSLPPALALLDQTPSGNWTLRKTGT